MLRVGAVKYAADGSASERTMRMSTPFEGTDDYGILTMSQAQIDAAVDDAVANGFRIGIHANGDVLFTVAREQDYGTNLIDGPYADTGLGRLFRMLMAAGEDMVAMEDFSLYPPSNNQPAAFLGAKIIDDGELLGVYAIQIPEQPINRIMQFSAGMGETGEIYLVGEDRLMRSTSRFFEESTVLRLEVPGETFERAFAEHGEVADPRFRIEHCSLVNPDLLSRIKAAGVVPTPFYTYAHYHGNKWPDYGPERMNSMFAHRSFIDYGILVAPASDFTPGPYEPMMALQSMVTRKDVKGRVWGEKQRISIREALEVCTINGAYASFEEESKGSLTPGKLADFVLLDSDPVRQDPEALQEINVVATYLGGRATFEA
jgi:hypothetical protein